MMRFRTIRVNEMSTRLRMFAEKWKVVLELGILIVTGLGLIVGVSRWTYAQEAKNLEQDNKIAVHEKQDMKRDSVFNIALIELARTSRILISMEDRWNNFEPEHIQLMKQHGIYPKKLYRGETK